MRQFSRSHPLPCTRLLLIALVVAYVWIGDDARRIAQFALSGAGLVRGDWWVLVTSGFVHYGVLHLAFNAFILYQLGRVLEPAIGAIRFSMLYLAGLCGGGAGAVILAPGAYTGGASGAVFALMAFVVAVAWTNGVSPMQTTIGALFVLNLVATFLMPGVSVGGHLGGAVAGLCIGAGSGAAGRAARGSITGVAEQTLTVQLRRVAVLAVVATVVGGGLAHVATT